MDVFGAISCAWLGHDWKYRKTYRVCDNCEKLEMIA